MDLNETYNPDDVDVRLQHFRLFHLIQMIDDGKIYLPQLGRTWTVNKQASFIESLMIKLPIPVFYFDGSQSPWFVIDGVNRLIAIHRFIKGGYKLADLEYMPLECNNKSFNELPSYLQHRIIEADVIAYIINPGTPVNIKYNIAKRITVSLQEKQILRDLFYPQAARCIKECAEHPALGLITRGELSSSKKCTLLTSYISYILECVSCSDLNDVLDKVMKTLEQDRNLREEFKQRIELSLVWIDQLFDDFLCCKPIDKKWNDKEITNLSIIWLLALKELQEEDFDILLRYKDLFITEYRSSISNGKISKILDKKLTVFVPEGLNILHGLMNKYIKR